MTPIRRFCLVALLASAWIGQPAVAAPVPSPWEQPAAALAEQIAGILGPGQAQLTIRNLSRIPTDEIPVIRRLLEQDLKAHGVQASGAESANCIRITLSENLRERLWVAEVVEGNETRVAMVHLELGTQAAAQASSALQLRKQVALISKAPVLAVLESNGWLAMVEPEAIALFFASNGTAWKESRRVAFVPKRALARDPRGFILPADVHNEGGFEAFGGGITCSGHFGIDDPSGQWPAWCQDSDDPWPISETDSTGSSAAIKAFYNASRNYFTGVITPSMGVDLPPFYSAALLPRPDGAGLLIGGIDGKVQLAESSMLKPIAGARDWGSDFAALHSDCGAGTQIIASGSGEALKDSLRAYELPALEVIPVSAPLAMEGTVTALWTVPDGKSVFAVVRKTANEGQTDQYEVDRVTANCN
ncbi:MAG: hypothetical protein P4L26_09505 [Terracidiphilus sp.]|nr:hypothetical protein [Terracidiphilus sp.]